MATFTLEDLQKKHGNNFNPRRVLSLDDIKLEAQTREQTAGNQFEKPKQGGVLGFGKTAFDTVFGGVKLAEGAGQALSTSESSFAKGVRGVTSFIKGEGFKTDGVQKQMSESAQRGSDIELELIKAIEQNKKEGKSTDRLEKALKMQQETQKVILDAQQDFVSSLKTTKEVAGSATRLVAAALAPTVGSKFAGLTGVKDAVGFGQGFVRGGLAGAGTGFVTGGLAGAGAGLEQNGTVGDVAMSAGLGSAGGTILGGLGGGLFGGLTGRANAKVDPATVLKNVTPDPAQMTPTEYKAALKQGLIEPKTATQSAQYKMPDSQKQVALKYSSVIDKDPVKTTVNINNTIGELDDEVGSFLQKNNGIFSRGELRNSLSSSLDDITDITVDQNTLQKAKTNLVNNFIDDLDKNDMTSLWEARKAFDQKIDKAFSGSPTLQKELKVAFRNSVQGFIKERTKNGVYAGYMDDMSNLFRLRDTVLVKATKERSMSAIQTWIKANPTVAKTAGWATLIGGGYLAGKVGIGSSNE